MADDLMGAAWTEKPGALLDVSSGESPDGLFHYTDSAGMDGIIRSGVLWASDYRFLNDQEELVYAKEAFVGALRELTVPSSHVVALDEATARHDQETFSDYIAAVEDNLVSDTFAVFVSCFCESPDLLSQWRAYGRDGGYCIEIDASHLREAAAQYTIGSAAGLLRVRYGVENAGDVVAAAMEAARTDDLAHPCVFAHYAAVRLTHLLASINHPGFAEEHEWRLVVSHEYDDVDDIDFRHSPLGPIPYIKIPLGQEAIRSVTIGPGKQSQLRATATSRFLCHMGIDAEVKSSVIPVRA